MAHPEGVWRQVQLLGPQAGPPAPIRILRAGIARWRAGDQVQCRERKDLVLTLVTAGAAWFEQDGRRHRVEAGEVFLQHHGSAQAHGTAGARLHKRWLQLSGAGLPSWLHTLGLATRDVITPRDRRALTARLREAFALFARRPPDYGRRLSLLACEILLLLAEGERLPVELERLLAAISQEAPRRPSLAALARRAGCPLRRLRRLCQQHLGRSPQELLGEERLARARGLLEDGLLSVKEIAAALGFADQFAFSHWFTRRSGRAPSAWRKAKPG